MVMKLYSVCDGPPSRAVRMLLNYLKIDYELVDVDFGVGTHLSADYNKLNPQQEIPVLDDNGFVLGESVAILQYLADKYSTDDKVYPRDHQSRALVNHRLCFNLAMYYRYIFDYWVLPIFYNYEQDPINQKKLEFALSAFNTHLERLGKKYVAGDVVTIADFSLVAATGVLDAVGYDFSKHSKVSEWYQRFKTENPEEWKIGQEGVDLFRGFYKNPPDLSHHKHPYHPVRGQKN